MSEGFRLTVQPEGKSIIVEQGENILHALRRMDAPIGRSDCGGAGVCGKCRIHCPDTEGLSPVSDGEREVLGDDQLDAQYRLACWTTLTGDATVVLPTDREEGSSPGGKEIHAPVCSADPAVARVFLDGDDLPAVQAACAENQPADVRADALTDLFAGLLPRLGAPEWASSCDYLKELLIPSFGEALAACSACATEGTGDGITLVLHEQRGLTGILSGRKTTSLGLAVDLGTTTIAAYLCDLKRGELLATAAMFNPQRKYGDDVISRISSAVESETTLADMQRAVSTAISQLAGRCLADCFGPNAEIEQSAIDELVVVGNTTMQTILAGDSPECLGRAPYQPKTCGAQNLPAEKLGFAFGAQSSVYLFPVISGFLGGDSVAAGLGGDLLEQDEPLLVIDIGTNGELLLGCGDRIVATSCATGPALEGAAISCGMRAVPGAISRVELDEQNTLVCHCVGEEDGARPLGICGSGLIDAIACLRKAGVILESGRYDAAAAGVICDDEGFPCGYVLVEAAKSGTGKDVILTLSDVRAFQLAKSALVVGIEKLLEHYGLEEVRNTCITGAFGAHFNWRNGLSVDLLSAKVTEGVVASGANLAGVGAMMALVNRKKRQEAELLADKAVAVELATDPEFNMCFVRRTQFPALL